MLHRDKIEKYAVHIILTHEQADFDALASLLAAHLLHDASIPVLPRRINRNVQAFLTLYGMEFPFIDPRDLRLDRIDVVTLVDTQSLVSIKGMDPDTKIQVIDHHPLRENLPEKWTVFSVETGATSTLLVELLRENINDSFSLGFQSGTKARPILRQPNSLANSNTSRSRGSLQ